MKGSRTTFKDESSESAEQLAHVLTDIFNTSLEQNVVPSCFKSVTITPAPRKSTIMRFALCSNSLNNEVLVESLPHQSLAKRLHRAMSSARYLSFTRTFTYECCLLVDHLPGGGEKTDPSHRHQHPHVYLAAGLPQ